MTNLYIHIGTHKTGSTSIQVALQQHAIELKNEGIMPLPLLPAFRSLHKIQSLDSEVIQRCREQLLHKIGENKKSDSLNYVISWEGLSGDASSGYSNTAIVAECIRKITFGFDVYIIVYLRRQDDFIESFYTQHIHEGNSSSFQEYYRKFDSSSFNWERLLRSYSEYFGNTNLIVRRYGKQYLPEKNSLLIDFSNIISSKYLALGADAGIINQGYSRDAIELARMINPHLTPEEKITLRNILQEVCVKEPFENYSFFTKDERRHVLSRYLESNSSVAKEYFNESSGVLFQPPRADTDTQIYQGLSQDTVTALLAKAIIFVEQKNMSTNSYFIRVMLRIEKGLLVILAKFPRLKSKLRYLATKMKLV